MRCPIHGFKSNRSKTLGKETYLGSHQNLNRTRLEQPFHDDLVLFTQCLVVVSDTVLQALCETLVADVVEVRLQIRLIDVQEPVGVVVSRTVQQKIVHSHAALASR